MKISPSKVVIVPHPPATGSQQGTASTPKSTKDETQDPPVEKEEKKEKGPEGAISSTV
jgi:hypothetical protein